MSGGNFPDLQNARHSLPLSRFKDLANSLAALKLRYCLNLGAMVPVPNQSPVPNGNRQPAQKLKTDARGNCSRLTHMNAEKTADGFQTFLVRSSNFGYCSSPVGLVAFSF